MTVGIHVQWFWFLAGPSVHDDQLISDVEVVESYSVVLSDRITPILKLKRGIHMEFRKKRGITNYSRTAYIMLLPFLLLYRYITYSSRHVIGI